MANIDLDKLMARLPDELIQRLCDGEKLEVVLATASRRVIEAIEQGEFEVIENTGNS